MTLAAEVTCRSPIQRLSDYRSTRGYACDVELVARFLDEKLITPWCRRRMKDSIGLVADSFLAAVNSNQTIDAIEVRRDILVAYRPVVADSVEALSLEVIGPETERDSSPVIRPSAEHACAPPEEARA